MSEVDTVSADVEFPFTKGDTGGHRTAPLHLVSVTSVHRTSSPHMVAMDSSFEVKRGDILTK